MKLYKYRSLVEMLYKELNYQELYFASYDELNDPMDLSARMDFTPTEEKRVSFLIWLVIKTTMKVTSDEISEQQARVNHSIIAFSKNEELNKEVENEVYRCLKEESKENGFVSAFAAMEILYGTFVKRNLPMNTEAFANELNRLAKKFLENSYVTCFSEKNNDWLMWSHYAGRHCGICLEFTLEREGLFPYRMPHPKIYRRDESQERYFQRSIEESVFWSAIHKVQYQEKQPHINFFDFAKVFDNEDDCDLIGLSKSWTHRYAFELTQVFATKTEPWSYEAEWRAIEINFGEHKIPEKRVRHYPTEFLSAIYFGMRTPEAVKDRIYKIFKDKSSDIAYYTCRLVNGKEIIFDAWEYWDE